MGGVGGEGALAGDEVPETLRGAVEIGADGVDLRYCEPGPHGW
jgi:hypothetical protein